ncbi:658c3251-9037-4873-a04d-de472a27e086 [Sclerotinia trifoliorum]|uniref:658c3251-9037-4873-a04d-de472a27e086 n=1 Tax=Sclerotinia trifoliorum TaxID=28548 RepID=A0A8H2W2N8_9HELO|nr:658c3251-9037-4873-a04d-de472a27e086 [Sclerotinia trifoliorum]
MQENDVIAIIIIILFLLLALIAYGIYRLVQKARGESSTVSGSTETSGSLADD